jgi:hydrogenase nickel incorporation protein HypA/HybF
MHEMSITQGILSVSLSAAQNAGAGAIRVIHLKNGAYSEVVPALVQECFDLLAKGTAAEGAQLTFSPLPLTVRCRRCGWSGGVPKQHIACGACGSEDLELLTGREFYVDSIEAE